jgi:hypothetical protein
MPANSRSQQRLFRWVHACQTGSAKNCPPNISKVASSISTKDAEDFARTKHRGLPERKKKGKKMKKKHLKSYVEFREDQVLENQLSNAQRGIAGMMMGGQSDPTQLNYFVRLMGRLLERAEQRLGVDTQAGESANAWNPEAIKLLQEALTRAASGSRSVNKQLSNLKQAAQAATPAAPQQQSGGPTPLNSL